MEVHILITFRVSRRCCSAHHLACTRNLNIASRRTAEGLRHAVAHRGQVCLGHADRPSLALDTSNDTTLSLEHHFCAL